jgi:hypothetical protein
LVRRRLHQQWLLRLALLLQLHWHSVLLLLLLLLLLGRRRGEWLCLHRLGGPCSEGSSAVAVCPRSQCMKWRIEMRGCRFGTRANRVA